MSITLALSLAWLGAQGAATTKVRNADAEVIEIALLQFFTPEEEPWQAREWRKGSTALLWGQLRSKRRQTASELLKEWIDPAANYESDPEYGARVREELAPVRALQAEVAKVSGASLPPSIVPLASFMFDSRIAVGEPKPTDRYFRSWRKVPLPNGQPGQPRMIARVDPPAYSPDGQIAVVKFSVPWSIHSADVLIGLRREGDRWTRVFARSVFFS